VSFKFTNNLVRNNQFGVKGDGTRPGQETLARYFPACVFEKNVFVGRGAVRYPNQNFYADALEGAGVGKDKYEITHRSPYKSAGTDGRDIGCDVTALAKEP